MWLLSETNIRQILFDIPIYYWTYLTIGSFYLIPVGLCMFVEQIFGDCRYRLILRGLWQINVIFTITTFILDLLKIAPLTSTLSIFYYLIVVMIIVLVSVTSYEAFKGNQKARMIGMGIFILAMTGIYDLLGWYYRVVPWVRYTSHWGLFIFYTLLFFVLRKQYLDMYLKLLDYSNEIEKKNEALHRMWLEVKESRDKIVEWNKTLEERVSERTEQLAQANEELVLMLDTLKRTQTQLIQSEKMSALGNLVAGVAHEINTPIGISVTAISHLNEKTAAITESFHNNQITRSELEKYLELGREMNDIILINLDRAANLIRSFKQVAVDQSSEVKRVFNVRAYIEEVLLSLQPKLKKTKHQIRVDCPDDLEIESYPGALSQIITNLIMNSLVHAFGEEDSGLITFAVSRDQSMINFCYSDNGKGINSENLEKIFNPFFTTMRGKGGTGLGLHIVYNIATQTLQGTINCQSKPNQGTTFIISFPA
jgi:signal transduction histidine kinase